MRYVVRTYCIQSDTSVLQGLLGKMVTAAARTIQNLGKKVDRNSCMLG